MFFWATKLIFMDNVQYSCLWLVGISFLWAKLLTRVSHPLWVERKS